MKQADKENNYINWKLFAQFLSAHKWACGLMAVLILLASTTVLIPPWILGRFVDQLYMPGQAWMWGGGLAGGGNSGGCGRKRTEQCHHCPWAEADALSQNPYGG